MFPAFLLWAAPFLVIPVAFLFCIFFFRSEKPATSVMRCCSSRLFFWPPFRLFFGSGIFPDTILRLGSKFHPRRIFLESASIEKKAFFLCVVGYCPRPFWTGVQAMDRGRSGPWTGVVVGKVASIYRTKTALYLLKDRELFESGHPGRELILSNRSVPPPLSGRSAGIERRLGLRKRISFMLGVPRRRAPVSIPAYTRFFDRQIWTNNGSSILVNKTITNTKKEDLRGKAPASSRPKIRPVFRCSLCVDGEHLS